MSQTDNRWTKICQWLLEAYGHNIWTWRSQQEDKTCFCFFIDHPPQTKPYVPISCAMWSHSLEAIHFHICCHSLPLGYHIPVWLIRHHIRPTSKILYFTDLNLSAKPVKCEHHVKHNCVLSASMLLFFSLKNMRFVQSYQRFSSRSFQVNSSDEWKYNRYFLTIVFLFLSQGDRICIRMHLRTFTHIRTL